MKFGMIGLGRMSVHMVRRLGGGQQCVAYDTHEAARAAISKSWVQLLESLDGMRVAPKQGAAARKAP